jgi:hypothetical protein
VVQPSATVDWPAPDPAQWSAMLQRAVEEDLAGELSGIRQRQTTHLGRELERIDDYFARYERELVGRASRSAGKIKTADRLAAAQAEHARHRADQVSRHEITVYPHVDALLLVAEPAWRAPLHLGRAHQAPQNLVARFVPRARRWEPLPLSLNT